MVKKGEDLTIVATGETLQRAYLASEILKKVIFIVQLSVCIQ